MWLRMGDIDIGCCVVVIGDAFRVFVCLVLFAHLSDKPSGRLALCFELMDMNIYELIRNRKTYVPENKIKLFMFQVLKVQNNSRCCVSCFLFIPAC
jgi:hypothetical protein